MGPQGIQNGPDVMAIGDSDWQSIRPLRLADGSLSVMPIGIPGGAIIQDTAPVDAPPNSFWWVFSKRTLYVNYSDVDSTQWVLAVPPVAEVTVLGFG